MRDLFFLFLKLVIDDYWERGCGWRKIPVFEVFGNKVGIPEGVVLRWRDYESRLRHIFSNFWNQVEGVTMPMIVYFSLGSQDMDDSEQCFKLESCFEMRHTASTPRDVRIYLVLGHPL